ncbi:MAG TPA: hypothetical protein VJL89_02910 [Thermodesulfovibrionia bacterium]|nr:hypothetical protein [Thermodesulfovibrionia bacterium]
MNKVFVDTSALIALANKSDAFHLTAHRTRKKLVKAKTFFITTSAVILELCNTFDSRSHVSRGNAFLDALRPLYGVRPAFQ